MSVDFNFEFQGETYYVYSDSFRSEEQFKCVAKDIVEDGEYITFVSETHDLDYPQIISNTFREGSGLYFLVKCINDGEFVPHRFFWNYEIGKNVKSVFKYRDGLNDIPDPKLIPRHSSNRKPRILRRAADPKPEIKYGVPIKSYTKSAETDNKKQPKKDHLDKLFWDLKAKFNV